jgi:hypothetical protein
MRAPGPVQTDALTAAKDALARNLTDRLKKVLQEATDIDGELTRGLRVIFGTEDTFRTEDRTRKDSAGPGDWWNWGELLIVEKFLRYHDHWTDAANLFDHYLRANGEPVNVEVDRMLHDVPAFRKDVDRTLDTVRQGPDGRFTTEWESSAPDLKDGDPSLNWYYALNNFRYRLVGVKNGDQITYHVEIYKRYDFGIPSEHRRDLEKRIQGISVFGVHQADVSRLNMVGKAKDFYVYGTSAQMTA